MLSGEPGPDDGHAARVGTSGPPRGSHLKNWFCIIFFDAAFTFFYQNSPRFINKVHL